MWYTYESIEIERRMTPASGNATAIHIFAYTPLLWGTRCLLVTGMTSCHGQFRHQGHTIWKQQQLRWPSTGLGDWKCKCWTVSSQICYSIKKDWNQQSVQFTFSESQPMCCSSAWSSTSLSRWLASTTACAMTLDSAACRALNHAEHCATSAHRSRHTLRRSGECSSRTLKATVVLHKFTKCWQETDNYTALPQSCTDWDIVSEIHTAVPISLVKIQ